jgi:hypothetical protein
MSRITLDITPGHELHDILKVNVMSSTGLTPAYCSPGDHRRDCMKRPLSQYKGSLPNISLPLRQDSPTWIGPALCQRDKDQVRRHARLKETPSADRLSSHE